MAEVRQRRLNILTAGILILQDNARSHAVCTVTDILEKYVWEVLPYLSYTPDMSPPDWFVPKIKEIAPWEMFQYHSGCF